MSVMDRMTGNRDFPSMVFPSQIENKKVGQQVICGCVKLKNLQKIY